jgi:hypothetical protein
MRKQSSASSEANVWDDAPQAPTPTVEKTVAAPKAPQSTSNA